MTQRWRALAVLATIAGAAVPVEAQDSPRDVAAAFFKAVAEERWRDAARQLDVAALDRFRRERIAAARLPLSRPRRVTAEELLRQTPDMPREVAEYQARKINEASQQPFSWIEWEFADVTQLDSLAALSAEEAAARWLQARDLRWRVEWAARKSRERGCPVPRDSGPRMPAPSHEVLGAIVTDSTTAYVLVRDGLFRRPDPDVDADLYDDAPLVITLRRRGNRWMILPRTSMLYGQLGIGFVDPACVLNPRPGR